MTWSYKTGEHGVNRVRVAEDPRRHGKLFVEFRESGGKKVRQYLTHTDKERAKHDAEELAAAFRETPSSRHAPSSLADILQLYLTEELPQRRHTAAGLQHGRAAAQLFVRAWGADRKPSTIALRDWNRYIVERRSGRLRPPGKARRNGRTAPQRPIRDTQIGHDLKFIVSVFKWATMAGDGSGGSLLERNPCTGFPIPAEKSPNRPRVREDRHQAMLAVAHHVDPQFTLALTLCHETGHRIASVRKLWWSDILWSDQAIRWRGEGDKQKNAHLTPLTAAALAALEIARRDLRTLGDVPIFLDSAGEKARSKSTFDKWLLQCERLANLEHVEGLGWHGYRRKFATELKDEPLSDLAELGGWKSTATLLKCYIEADDATMRRALGRRRTLEEKREEAM